mgnify:FL=1
MSDSLSGCLALLIVVAFVIATLMIFGDPRCLVVNCVIVKETAPSMSEHLRELP